MQTTTTADALARATYNALLYCAKDGPFASALIMVTRGYVSFLTSTKGYNMAWSRCHAETPDGLTDGVAYKVSRKDLENLEERCREGKKERVVLEFLTEDCEIWYRGEKPEKDLQMEDIFEDGIDDDSWDEINLAAFRALINQRETDPLTRRVMLAPEYIRKLGQLKRDKDTGADFCFAGEDDPVLVKVGPDFRLVIEPIDRERHRKALGEGVTW